MVCANRVLTETPSPLRVTGMRTRQWWGFRAWLLAPTLGAGFGCGGGQTGQPTSIEVCEAPYEPIALDEPVRGVVPIDAAQAVAGTYVSPFTWSDADDPNPVEDEITITLAYTNGPARYSGCGWPEVEMEFEVSLRDSDVHESGKAWGSFMPPISNDDWGFDTFNAWGRVGGIALWGKDYVTDVSFKWYPSGMRVAGSMATRAYHPEIYGRYPIVNGEEIGLDDPALSPTLQGLLDELNALEPGDVPWGSPEGSVAPRLELSAAEETAWTDGGYSWLDVGASFDFGDDLAVEGAGEILIAHGIEEPSVHFLTLTVPSSNAFDGKLIAPDGPSCNLAVSGSVTLVRSGPREPFEVMADISGFGAGCVTK